jgi:hypothetical protein
MVRMEVKDMNFGLPGPPGQCDRPSGRLGSVGGPPLTARGARSIVMRGVADGHASGCRAFQAVSFISAQLRLCPLRAWIGGQVVLAPIRRAARL